MALDGQKRDYVGMFIKRFLLMITIPFKSLKVRAGAMLVFALSLFIFLVGCLEQSSLTSKPEPTPTPMSPCELDTSINQCLLSGSREGDIDRVRDALKNGADVDYVDHREKENGTPLMRASRKGHLEIVKALIAAGANVNIQHNGRTALIYAIWLGHLKIVKVLIVAGADVNHQDNVARTALIYASESGYLEIAKALIAAGANVNIKDGMGDTALMRASESSGHLEIAKVLIESGADVNLRNSRGKTALSYAKHGASQTMKSKRTNTFASSYAKRRASQTQYAEIIRVLKEAGATE